MKKIVLKDVLINCENYSQNQDCDKGIIMNKKFKNVEAKTKDIFEALIKRDLKFEIFEGEEFNSYKLKEGDKFDTFQMIFPNQRYTVYYKDLPGDNICSRS